VLFITERKEGEREGGRQRGRERRQRGKKVL
jgi:hypothetical protein